MMNLFLLKLLLSFIVGGLWTIIATVLADKFGTKIGGFIAGLPSTIVFGLFFIAWTQTLDVAVQSTTVVPAVGAINYLFLVIYAYFIVNGLWKALFIASFTWSMLTLLVIKMQPDNYPLLLILYTATLLLSYWLLESVFKVKSLAGKKIKYTKTMILWRGLLSGSIISLAVLMAKIGGPIFGGVFSTFPALFLSTLLITYFTQGPAFSQAITKSLMLSSITVVIYSIIVRYTYLPLGILLGTIISTVGSLMSGYLTYRFVIQKSS